MEALNVYQKLNEARAKFHATELKKTGRNTFANYSYFELGDFLIPALGIFKEVGLAGIVSFGETQATMRVVNVEKPEEYIGFSSPMGSASLKGCHEVQNIGAVETYQRRYLWTAVLEIVEHDALDATTGNKKFEDREAGGQHQREAVSRQSPDFPEGPAKNITELKSSARTLWREIESCGDNDTLNAFLDMPDTRAALKQMADLENPAHREIWDGDGKDNPGVSGLIIRKQTEFAQHIADIARA